MKMTQNSSTTTTPSAFRKPGVARRQHARGNTLVLVAGILALLVIIATAFITRSQGNRRTGEAQQRTEQLDDSVNIIRDSLAEELARQLFVAPINTNDPFVLNGFAASANWPRNPIASNARRYGVDLTTTTDPLDPTKRTFAFPYNRAPYETRPWTNWPDAQPLINGNFPDPDDALNMRLPVGPGNVPGPLHVPIPGLAIYNPPGNPGFGDFRLLASTEPLRWNTGFSSLTHDQKDQDSFFQWEHLSNPSRAENGYRAITDISDIGGTGRLVTDLNIPIEQFTTIKPNSLDIANAQTAGYGTLDDYSSANDFMVNWSNWFGFGNTPLGTYAQTYIPSNAGEFRVPTNFYRLKDPTPTGSPAAYPAEGARSADQYRAGTPRHTITRVLADADGDGFTDSLWFTSPAPMANGLMQIVAMRVVDNSAMVNVNAATRFNRLNTRGETPADIAIVGNDTNLPIQINVNRAEFNVGLLDNYDNAFARVLNPISEQQQFGYAGGTFSARGQRTNGLVFRSQSANFGNPIGMSTSDYSTNVQYPPSRLRLEYWRRNGRVPFNRNPVFTDDTNQYSLFPELTFTGFDLSNEIDLRAYHGNNLGWVFTPLEWSTQPGASEPDSRSILRSSIQFSENVEYDEYQKTARALLRDSRHRLTTHNGSRNETAPTWFWPTLDIGSSVSKYASAVIDPASPDRDQSLLLQRRKFDLRGGRNLVAALNTRTVVQDVWVTNQLLWTKYKADLRDHLERALIVRERQATLPDLFSSFYVNAIVGTQTPTLTSYYHNPSTPIGPNGQRADVARTQEMVAGLAANIATGYRTGDRRANLAPYNNLPDGFEDGALLIDAVPVRYDGAAPPNRAQMPLEGQPFLTEAFIAHVYSSDSLPEPPANADGPLDSIPDGKGNYVVAEHERRTIVAVQIANPFDHQIDLHEYVLSVFGQELSLAVLPESQRYLQPATEWYPTTATFVAIGPDSFAHPHPKFGGSVASFKALWHDFLDVGRAELKHRIVNYEPNIDTNDPLIFLDVRDSIWSSSDRDVYDNPVVGQDEHSVELRHRDSSVAAGVEVQVVVDRFDAEPVDDSGAATMTDSFAEKVKRLADSTPPTGIDPSAIDWMVLEPEFPGIRIYQDDMYITYARVTRAWGYDFDQSDGFPLDTTFGVDRAIEPFERNCRFVFAEQQVTGSDDPTLMNNDPTDTLMLQGQLAGDQHASTPDLTLYRGASFQLLDEAQDTEPWDVASTMDVPSASWFTLVYRNSQNNDIVRKPTFFDNRGYELDPAVTTGGPQNLFVVPFADKGFYGDRSIPDQLNFPMQMLLKNDDFKQVGELMNVWMHGTLVELDPLGAYVKTERTFAESMRRDIREYPNEPDAKRFVGRLHVEPVDLEGDAVFSPMAGVLNTTPYLPTAPATYLAQSAAMDPAIPVGARLIEGFVCDGRGLHNLDQYGGKNLEYFLGGGFRNEITPGLLNINTAPMEVLRTLPHWARLVNVKLNTKYPFVNVAKSIEHYRSRLNGGPNGVGNPSFGYFGGPDYSDPANLPDNMRRDYGFMSLGELMLMNADGTPMPAGSQSNQAFVDPNDMTYFDTFNNSRQVHMLESWRMDFTGAGLAADRQPQDRQIGTKLAFGSWLSTDQVQDFAPDNLTPEELYVNAGDEVSGDSEEASLLFAGASNLISTRSDVFTVYMKVRTFKQNPVTGVWNALDREMVVDDSRYVMMVDRSNVESPGDKPLIRYFEKLPN
jgi:hypothetical protein